MEPRPPRPRQPYLPPDAAASSGFQRAAGGPEQGLYAPPPGYSAPPPYPPELELVPRRQRHRQRIARNVLLALLVVTAIGVLGWNLRDRFFGAPPSQNQAQLAPTAPADQPVTGPIASPDVSAGAAPTQAPLVNNLLATSTPTPAPASEDRTVTTGNTEGEEPTATAAASGGAEEPEEAPAPADLAALLPEETELPVEGLAESNSGDRTLSEVVANVATDADTQSEVEELLESWGWQGNPFRDFSAPDASQLAPDATTMMFVSIHGFGNQEAASEALTYFSNVIVASQGYADVQADPIGDENRLLRVVGTDGTTNVVAYIVDGPLLYRIGGSSPAGDPTGDVLQLSDQLINRE